eukprot:TRINITY_DN128027_c0_g1_i1.p1 TRINITY_DN128027_c0_g1~~TRINITY_DN128027_c0_g1_i1.p1  ORF type:complete len:320 (-),score=71.40 TRINITY_DN128027_c0_g1_i1:136-1095(-)
MKPFKKPNDKSKALLSLENVHKTYLLGLEGVAALRGVSLDVKRGEFVIIVGKSGGGKTSTLNICGTIDRPTRGTLNLCGYRITSRTPDSVLAKIRLEKLGFVFQNFNLIENMSALENTEMPMILLGKLSAKERRERAQMLLHKVGIAHRADHRPAQLSGGEQQRVTIARALANKPDILLLDEPTGDLDSVSSDTVIRILMELNEKDGVTLVMVTHDQALTQYAHRVVSVLDGKIQRIEDVPSHMRNAAKSELFSKDIQILVDPSEEMQAKITKHILSECQHTKVRRPAAYRTSKCQKPFHPIQSKTESTPETIDVEVTI